MNFRRDSVSMEPMTTHRHSLMGPLTRSEEILQFERLRHQIHIVEALRGLKISNSTPTSPIGSQPTHPPLPWRKLQIVHFSDLVMDTVQEGCIIKCRTVVDPLLFGSLQTLVEEIDGGYKVMMLSIDNFVNGMNVMELGVLFPIGRELWIRNPSVKAHEGRPIIKVDDPINLKLRQTSREIERILEFGPADAKGWKVKGKELIKRGRLTEAVDSYSSGINYGGGDNKLRASLFRRRAELLYKLEKYQAARRDALSSISLRKNDKSYLLLAKILLELRSYSTALEYLHQMSELDGEADKFLRQLWTCDIEHRDGIYHVIPIAEEAHLHDRVVHADYVSPNIELRLAGAGGRGLFAKKKLPGGTLLVVNKAVVCVYADEIPKQPERNEDEEPKDMFDVVRQQFVEHLTQMLKNGTGRRVLQLAGGSQSNDTSINLRRDDVYDNDIHFIPDQIRQIITKNSFGGAQRSQILADAAEENSPQSKVGGGALFYAPSFFNHSCIPNSTYFTIGDMMFVKTNRDVEEDEELMIHYIYVEKLNEKERNETLQRVWEFTCQCSLCEWERENQEICSEADKIMEKVLEFAKSASPESAVKKFLSAKKKLYQLYRCPPPNIDNLISLSDSPATSSSFSIPSSLASYLVLIFRELSQGEIREYIRDTEFSGPVNAEYHFLLKNYSHYERVSVAGLPAIRVWQYLYRSNSSNISPEVVDKWLKEAKDAHDMLLGDGHFYYQYGEVIKEIKSK